MNTITNTIIDMYGENAMNEDMATVKAAGVTHIIHQASQGLRVDPMYAERMAAARAVGIGWGCYHFLTNADPIEQEANFARVIQYNGTGDPLLVAVDVEREVDDTIPTLAQVLAFVQRVRARIGRYPVIYSTNYILKELGWDGTGELRDCPFWIAGYGPPPPYVPTGWPLPMLWQYTNGSEGPEPRRFPGLANAYDRSEFRGTLDQLNAVWGAPQTQPQTTGPIEAF